MATKGLLNVSSAPSSTSTCRRQGGNIEEMTTTANVAEAYSSKAANVGECSAFVLKMRKERVKQETASLLSTVARGILPKELAITPPEWFLLADSGANVHVLYEQPTASIASLAVPGSRPYSRWARSKESTGMTLPGTQRSSLLDINPAAPGGLFSTCHA